MSKQITISISDSLYDRLQVVKEKINISRVCQAAIKSVVSYREILTQEGPDMATLIERLRAEKKEHDEHFYNMGKKDGLERAKSMSYLDLLEVSGDSFTWQNYFKSKIYDRWLEEEIRNVELPKYKEGFDEDSYVDGWIEGVTDFWKGIKDKIK